MNSKYNHTIFEEKISLYWEEQDIFNAKVNVKREPFCIILPPPNANANLHAGHAMFVYEDVMIRYNKLLGKEVLWLPGMDHAGLETQFVFEKHLRKKGKSRFDYNPDTLRSMIHDFVEINKPNMRKQLKRMGFALDWSKEKYTMDKDIIDIVYDTFKKLYDEGLIYRDTRLVNYSVPLGTAYSDLEVAYEEQTDPLYFIKYGPFELATVRPETKFGDTGIAVNPKDGRYKKWIGKEIEAEGLLGKFKIKVVGDDAVDPEFGTGVVKVTPAHDFNDFDIAKRHNLPLKQVIGFNGRLNEHAGSYEGMKVVQARKKIAEDMQAKGIITRVKEDYVHRVAKCYKSGAVIEPLPLEQWFLRVKPLVEKAKGVIQDKKITFFPQKYVERTLDLYEELHDWNISRQTVWGIPIPAFLDTKTNEWIIEVDKKKQDILKKDPRYKQDTDTFDTWFSSGQWPYATLLALSGGKKENSIFSYFYPTSIMETGNDILRSWVMRMIMLGLFYTKEVPFKHVFLHGLVRDKNGQKMSKSKGNVINPVDLIEKYGADALRAALLFGTKDGSDVSLSEDRVRSMRNFANKVWNIGRLLHMSFETFDQTEVNEKKTQETLEKLSSEFSSVKEHYYKHMNTDLYSKAFDEMYHFVWHSFADVYLEELKHEIRSGNQTFIQKLRDVYYGSLVLLHPFMPFVTEAVWQETRGNGSSIISSGFMTSCLTK